MEKEHEAHDVEAAARAQLRQITAELEGLRFRLLGVHASLAGNPREVLPLTRHPLTPASAEIVSAVECVLVDQIGPALRSLQEVIQEESPPEGGEESQ
jgi:hypothetical protein